MTPPPAADRAERRTWAAGRLLMLTLLAFAVLIAGLGVWSVNARITSAVIGPGTIRKATTMTAVQHPIGGVVETIHVRNGDRVALGDVLLRLEGTGLRSELAAVEGELFEVLANIARLEAMIEDRTEIILPPLFTEAMASRPDLSRLLDRQEAQLRDYFDTMDTRRRLLDEQTAQVAAQIEGAEAEHAAKTEERALMLRELEAARQLADRQLINLSDLYDAERKEVTMRGELGTLTAQIAGLRGRVSELVLERHAVAPEMREKAADELARQRPLRARFVEQRRRLLDDLARLEIRAPIPGTIHDSQVQGRRSVAVAARPLMMIVPEDETVQVEVRISSTDIDQVFEGQDASLRFNAYKVRDMPIVLGRVERISADAFEDPVTRKFYYRVVIALIDSETDKLGDRELLVGMPVDAYLATTTQAPIDYVIRPLQVYLDRAFRDA
ncbi:HlyD family type I secretion periplasmic adaptor subunit [Jannaschia sp. 2305UL9-9]|uniref:HlyD family type I secretion periplasmic adaptor subunit n=1 Tax=Jannaschia sp. 2305UL9-9 TaxID=3121638 RepID=UPI003528AD70